MILKVILFSIISLLCKINISAQNYEERVINCIETNSKSIGLDFENEIKNIKEDLIKNSIINSEFSSIILKFKDIKKNGIIEEVRTYENVLFEQIGLKTIDYCSVLHHYIKDSTENSSIIKMNSEIKLYILNLKTSNSIKSFNSGIATIIDSYLKPDYKKSKLWNFIAISYLYLFSQTQETKVLNIKLPEFTPYNKNNTNLPKIFVNKKDEVLFEGNRIKISEICNNIKSHINNNIGIKLQNERQTKYQTYLKVYKIIKSCYTEHRNTKSKELYSKKFDELNLKQKKIIMKLIPIKIVEIETK